MCLVFIFVCWHPGVAIEWNGHQHIALLLIVADRSSNSNTTKYMNVNKLSWPLVTSRQRAILALDVEWKNRPIQMSSDLDS